MSVRLSITERPATMENIHAMCEDYRAAASIDLKHDEADLNRKVACPLLTLWGEREPMGRLYDILEVWRARGTKVTGKGLPGGHNLQEEEPVWNQVLAELRRFSKHERSTFGSFETFESFGFGSFLTCWSWGWALHRRAVPARAGPWTTHRRGI